MAQIPNAYYNSPWIADAARNLASALAPPDPEKQLAAKRSQWELDRMQQLAGIADTDRENQHNIEDLRAEMLRPVYNPLTGEIDQDLTNKKVLKNWADAVDLGDDPKIGASISGEMNPEVAVKKMMAQIKQAQALSLSGYGYDRRAGLQDDAQDWDAEKQRRAQKWQGEQNALRLQNYLDRQAAKTSAGGKVAKVPVPIIKEISFGLDDRIDATGKAMPVEKRNKFAELAIARWQQNGNVEQALNEQWAASFPNSTSYADAESDPDTGSWYNKTRGGLNPVFDDDPAPPLAQVVAPTAAPTPTPVTRTTPPPAATKPTATPAPKSAAPPARLLKEGVETTFKGKGTWTLKNGVPTRVK